MPDPETPPRSGIFSPGKDYHLTEKDGSVFMLALPAIMIV
jgi:hypothetical protein